MDVERIQEALRALDIEAWLLYDCRGTNPVARRVTGLEGKALTRRWFCGIPQQGEPVWIVSRVEAHLFAGVPGQVRPYASWRELQNCLSEFLQSVAPPDRLPRIAMEYSPMGMQPDISWVDAGTVELVWGLGVRVVSSGDLLQFTEARWGQRGAELHFEAARKLLRIKEECWQEIVRHLRDRLPLTEWDVQQFLLRRFAEENLETEHEPIVAVGRNTALPHYFPQRETAAPIGEGEVLLVDLWAKCADPEAIFADITWVAFTGREVPSAVREVFEVVRRARDAVVDFIQERYSQGEPIYGFEADDVARRLIAEAGYGPFFLHRTGHSLGRHVHGQGAHLDNWETHEDRQLLMGTGFTIEPGIYLPEFGVRSEINMYLSEAAAWVTTLPLQTDVVALLRD